MENQSSSLGCYAISNRTEARNLRFELDGHDYTWSGGFGAILKSCQRPQNEFQSLLCVSLTGASYKL